MQKLISVLAGTTLLMLASSVVAAQDASGITERETMRNRRYGEIILTYRKGLQLRTEVWNTFGLNDCPDAQWKALDADKLQTQYGAVRAALNGPRYWVLDEIAAEGGITGAKRTEVFDGLEMALRAELKTRLRGSLVGEKQYRPMTVQRNTRYTFFAGKFIYTLTDPDGNAYVMQSYAQLIDPELALDALETLGKRLSLPNGWTYRAVRLADDFVLRSEGKTTIVQDDLLNTYQLAPEPPAELALYASA